MTIFFLPECGYDRDWAIPTTDDTLCDDTPDAYSCFDDTGLVDGQIYAPGAALPMNSTNSWSAAAGNFANIEYYLLADGWECDGYLRPDSSNDILESDQEAYSKSLPWKARICGMIGGPNGGIDFVDTNISSLIPGSFSLVFSSDGTSTQKIAGQLMGRCGAVYELPVAFVTPHCCWCAELSVDPCEHTVCWRLEVISAQSVVGVPPPDCEIWWEAEGPVSTQTAIAFSLDCSNFHISQPSIGYDASAISSTDLSGNPTLTEVNYWWPGTFLGPQDGGKANIVLGAHSYLYKFCLGNVPSITACA